MAIANVVAFLIIGWVYGINVCSLQAPIGYWFNWFTGFSYAHNMTHLKIPHVQEEKGCW